MRALAIPMVLAAAVALPAFAQAQSGNGAAAQPAVGAPDSDVQRIHVIEKRPFTEQGRWELSLFGPVQVNAKFTEHFGVATEVAYHLRENLAVQLGAVWFPLAQQSGLTEQLVIQAHQEPLAANALLLQGAAMAGLELMPVYGKLNIFDGKILRVGFYLNAGLGVAKTRLQLAQANTVNSQGQTVPTDSGRTFGDAGIRPMAALGAGFRVFLGERITLRLELRDLVYSAYVSQVNGCNLQDAAAIASQGEGAASSVSSGCDVSAFNDGKGNPMGNAAIAEDQIKQPSADVVNNLTAYTGLSYLF